MPDARDAVIVGGGHNGLVTAFYLAKAGYKPLVMERRAQPGGAALTEEFYPGFRCSILAHSAGPLRPDIVRDMQLDKYGLRLITPDVGVVSHITRRTRADSLQRRQAIGAGNRQILAERCSKYPGISNVAGESGQRNR